MNEEPCTINVNETNGLQKLLCVEGPVNLIGDPNGVPVDGNPCFPRPIIKAAGNKHDNHEIVKALIDMGADVNVSGWGGLTPLHFAAALHKIKILEVLLKHGADVHQTNQEGYTALHFAAFSIARERGSLTYDNDSLVVKAILRKNSNVNARDNDGNTPLMQAVQGFNLDIVKQLLEAGADVNGKNKYGRTCMHLLFNSTGKTDMMIELIKEGAPLQAVDENGYNPLKTFQKLFGTSDEFLIDIKALAKTALLVTGEEKESYCVNEEIKNFADECHAEVQEMRSIRLSSTMTLCNFALHGCGNSQTILDSAYEVIMNKAFKIYDDYIVAHFEKKHLCLKVIEKGIYTNNDRYDIKLPEDVLEHILKFLSKKEDLLNLLRVFTNCLPPRLKRQN